MNFLAEKLATSSASDVLWFSQTAGAIEASKFAQALLQIPYSDWHCKRVAIGNLPVGEFVSALIFLDGLAESILILPSEDDSETRSARLVQAKIDIVVENDGLGFTKLFNSAASSQAFDRPASVATTWLLPTSGTTGTPKLIAHTYASLTRSMTNRHVGDAYIWGSLYSLRRFAGLQVFLQSWMCDTPLVLNEEDADLTDVLNRLTEQGCNALSATPSMWRKLAMHPLFDKLDLKQITLGGEIVDQAVLDLLSKQFPAARITHIYASTEAGVGFAVRDGKAGFPTEYLLKPPAGVAMRVDEHGHLWLAPMSGQVTASKGAGIYSAAFALSGMFVNFVLQAMGSDYYPRLTSVATNKAMMNRMVNEQTEIGLLLGVPGLLATSRTQLDRLLDPAYPSVTLATIVKAASALGKKISISFGDMSPMKTA